MERTSSTLNIYRTLFVALFVATDAINLVFTSIFPALSGFMATFYALTGFGIIFCYILEDNILNLTMKFKFVLCIVLILTYYGLTSLSVGGTTLSITFFFVCVLLPMLMPLLVKIDVKFFLRVIFIVPSFGIVKASSILQLNDREALTMGKCYALLIPVVSALTYLMMYYKEDSRRTKLILLPSIIINLIYYIRIVLYGSRGPILSVILCFFFLVLFRRKDINDDKKRIGKLLLFAIVLSLCMLYFWEIIQFVSSFASRIGINIRAIDKIYKLRQTTSIWNGRDSITSVALSGIAEKPIIGHGMSTFLKNTGIAYPHNFILQVLYDGGILLFIALIVPVIIGVIKVICKGTINDLALFSILFFASVPGALFSGDCWKNGVLWLLTGFFITGKLPNFYIQEIKGEDYV